MNESAVFLKSATKSNDRSKHTTQLELAFIIFILRKFSNRNNPLSANRIAYYIGELTGEDHSEKTIRRKLDILISLQQNSDESNINNSLTLTFGGNIEMVDSKGHKLSSMGKSGKQSRFYFNPIMNISDVSMICGAITSNRYLSSAEKEYLLSREMTLTTLEQDDQSLFEISALAPHTADIKTTGNFHAISPAPALLQHANLLYDAIEKGYMISLIYGIYNLSPDKQLKPYFHARNAEKPYKLNPYAMLWNNGSFYLLATHSGHDNPVHFRIDRIISVKPVTQEDDATQKMPRAKLPDTLKQFFKIENKKYEFLPEKYTATYPLMGIYDNTDYQNCYIECTATELSILIDAFGMDLHIYPSSIIHNTDETDLHGNPKHFLSVGIKNVQYDNILQFCLQHHTAVTAIYPEKLVNDIKETLSKSLYKYQTLTACNEIKLPSVIK